ncbi:hypothetical protein HPP_1860 [Hydrangea phyllody phytoplasma]|uniref:Uncharacterized protein n=1 Tax=Hydrangea phyllody phytoplasma TaxID=238673 RepID=A0ABQ1EJD3_9MOLU|nr:MULTISPECIES: super-infection exclusion protein B [16SrI (Aster yellows group)]GFZ75228.1 hypothetical protein HPP_1860 [Hydrangea phyllody phytoplasma]GLH61842.1 hypothetical protein HP2P_2490 [Hydrangea phyllody phytoplasma]
MFESIFFKFIFIVFICLLVIFIMNYFYRKNVKNKIINYLLSCSNLEQEILKSFLQNPHKTFPLTKDANITKNLLQLNIIFLKEIVSGAKYNNYVFNPLIKKIIHKNKDLKKIYHE